MSKNYIAAGCTAYASVQNKNGAKTSPNHNRNYWKSMLFLFCLLFMGAESNAQVSSSLNPSYGYTFSNTTSTYTSLGTTGTVFQSGAALNTNAVSAAIPLPFVFTFNGIKENKIFISNNGFITFGIAPSTTQYTPISATNGFDGVIAGFAVNTVLSTAVGAAGEIRYGTKTNGDFAIQFQDLGQATSSEIRMTFQILLKADGKTIQIVYGPNNIGSSISSPCQVGLRGTSQQDFNNRTVASGGNWNTTGGTAGTTNAQSLACTNITTLPTSGRTFQWTPTAYAPTYLTTPLTTTQNFNSWTNGSGSGNVPTINWATNGYGSASWQIDNVGASSAGWTNGSGSYTPADYNGIAFSHSARFNSFNANVNQVGYLDYYVDLSGATSFLSLDFHTINTTGSDMLQVFLSTDGGATFTQIGGNIFSSAVGWRAQKIPLGTLTSATTIIRFKGTADNGNTDIGLDNVRINNCVPNGNTFATAINLGPLTTSVNYSGNNLSENCWTDNYTTTSSPGGPIARPGNDVFYKFQITECLSTLHISTCFSEFDTYLHILDASGNTLFSDDDGCDNPLNASNLGSSIMNMLLPIGTYYVVVEGRGTADTGTFTLSFDYSPGSPVPAPTGLACYQTATFNSATCSWVVTGTQPAMPTLACYQTANFNNTACAWEVTGTQPTTQSPNTIISEGFDNFSSLATAGWSAVNTSTPAGAGVWSQGGSDWVAQAGAPTSWARVDYSSVLGNNTISNWLIAPQRLLKNGDVITFWTRTETPVSFPDRLQVRLSTTGAGTNPISPTDLGSYTTLLADINPTLTTTGYPTTFTKYTLTVSGLAAPANCRVAFRYFVTGGGPSGANSNTIGIDTFSITRALPPLACYESYVFNGTTCQYDVTGTQPAMPTLACYQTANFNTETCTWDVTGTQPAMPTLLCYQTAAFNSTTCTWDVTGSQPEMPTLACYETASFNSTTCTWDLTGTQPVMPTLACYETANFNTETCIWDVTGSQPEMPTLACYETAAFNSTTCTWDVTGSQPEMPTLACYESASFNSTTCVWDVTGTQPVMPTLACYETANFNTETCIWDVTGTQPAMPTLACYETASFNSTTCTWDIAGTQPVMPTLACYETATFNSTTCVWDVTGSQPEMPTLACYETASFNSTTCVWDVTGSQTEMPTLACYETATFNSTTCVWDVTGTQPVMPTLACYETASFNSTTCAWDIAGTQPEMPILACYETASFNSTTCTWDVTGTQPVMPTLACYETANFNTETCIWDVTGTQPAMPTLACYETASFNSTTCTWDIAGTQPVMPTLACYETATFNSTTCVWDVTGTQPAMPTLLCYQTATFNNNTCNWVVTGTQPTLGSLTVSSLNSYTWSGPYGTGLTYTASGVYTSTVGCNVATLNLTITVNTLSLGSTCGATINGLSVTITTPFVSGVSTYTFKLTNLNTNAFQIINRPVNSFALSNYAGITLGTPYRVEVSVNGGASYGTPCTFNTPTPTATIGTQCGTTLTAYGQWIYADYYASVTGYRFRIKNMATNAVVVYDSPNGLNKFNFNQLPATFRRAGTTYFVEVALRNTNGTYLPYSTGCNIITPGVAPTVTKVVTEVNDFSAVAYPNPFAENFLFDVKSVSKIKIHVMIYDMLGRQIENKTVDPADINNLQFGGSFPAGVYNVILSQGENTQILRVVKR